MSEERWLPVVGYEGYYEVSDLGRVRGLDRVIRHKRSGTSAWPGRFLKMPPGSHGYIEVGLSREGKRKTHCVHVLVLTAFAGPAPDGQEVCHKNGVRSDARLENLRWGTRASNLQDMREHGTHHYGSRPACKHEHKFAGRNLRVESNGSRTCITCSRARARCSQHPDWDFKEVADRIYVELMAV